VRQRQKDDWIEDGGLGGGCSLNCGWLSDGTGIYVEDGRDVCDSDLDEDDNGDAKRRAFFCKFGLKLFFFRQNETIDFEQK
jgi:hypothetical protein